MRLGLALLADEGPQPELIRDEPEGARGRAALVCTEAGVCRRMVPARRLLRESGKTQEAIAAVNQALANPPTDLLALAFYGAHPCVVATSTAPAGYADTIKKVPLTIDNQLMVLTDSQLCWRDHGVSRGLCRFDRERRTRTTSSHSPPTTRCGRAKPRQYLRGPWNCGRRLARTTTIYAGYGNHGRRILPPCSPMVRGRST